MSDHPHLLRLVQHQPTHGAAELCERLVSPPTNPRLDFSSPARQRLPRPVRPRSPPARPSSPPVYYPDSPPPPPHLLSGSPSTDFDAKIGALTSQHSHLSAQHAQLSRDKAQLKSSGLQYPEPTQWWSPPSGRASSPVNTSPSRAYAEWFGDAST